MDYKDILRDNFFVYETEFKSIIRDMDRISSLLPQDLKNLEDYD